MNAKDTLLNAYYAVEDRWFDLLDWMDGKKIPVYKLVDPIEKHGIPSLPVFIAVILLALYFFGGVFSGIGFISGGQAEVPISIQVVDQQMAHVPRASLTILDSSGNMVFNGTTDDEGLLELKLLPGEYIVTASAEECDSSTETITVTGEQAEPFSIGLTCRQKPSAEEATLCVRSDTGEKVGNVFYTTSDSTVKKMCGQGECTLLVDSSKEYLFSAETDKYTYSAEYSGETLLDLKDSISDNCILLQGTAKPVEKGQVCVNVFQPDGKTLIPYFVNVKLVNPDDAHEVITKKNTLEGTACIDMEYYTPFKVEVSPNEHAYYLSNETYLLNETVPQINLNVTLQDAAKTTFVVKSGLNTLAGVHVKVVDAQGVVAAEGDTASNGKLMKGLKRGEEYTAMFYKRGYRTTQAQVEGGKNYVINMTLVPDSEYGRLSVLVLYKEDNASVSDATVTLYNYNLSLPTEYAAPSFVTGSGGTVLINWVDPGTYCVKVMKGSSVTECNPDTTVEVKAGKKEYLTVYMESQKVDVVVFALKGTAPARNAGVALSSVLGKQTLSTDAQGKAVFRNAVRKSSMFSVSATWTDPETKEAYFKEVKNLLAEEDTELTVQLEKPATSINITGIFQNNKPAGELVAGKVYHLAVSHGRLAEYNSTIEISLPEEVNIDVYGNYQKYYNKTTHSIIMSSPAPENDTMAEERIPFRIRRGDWTSKENLKILYHGTWEKSGYSSRDPATGEKEFLFNASNTVSLFKKDFAIQVALLDENGNTYTLDQARPGDNLTFYAKLAYEGDERFKGSITVESNKDALSMQTPEIKCPETSEKKKGSASGTTASFLSYCRRSDDPEDYGILTGETVEIWAPFKVNNVLENNTEAVISLNIGSDSVAFKSLTIVLSRIVCKNPEDYETSDWEKGTFVCDEENGLMERTVLISEGQTYPPAEKPSISFEQEFTVSTTISPLPGYYSSEQFSINAGETENHVRFSRVDSEYPAGKVTEYTLEKSDDNSQTSAMISFNNPDASYTFIAVGKGWLPGDANIHIKKDDNNFASATSPVLLRVTKENLPEEQCIDNVCLKAYAETETRISINPVNTQASQNLGDSIIVGTWVNEEHKGRKLKSASISAACSSEPWMEVQVVKGGRHLTFSTIYAGQPVYYNGALHLVLPAGTRIPTGNNVAGLAINLSCEGGMITGNAGPYPVTLGQTASFGPAAEFKISSFKEAPWSIIMSEGKTKEVALEIGYYGTGLLTDQLKVQASGSTALLEDENNKISVQVTMPEGTSLDVSNIDKTTGSIANTWSEFSVKKGDYSRSTTEQGIRFRDRLRVVFPLYAVSDGTGDITINVGDRTFTLKVTAENVDYEEEVECDSEKQICWKMWIENGGVTEKPYDATKTVQFIEKPVLKANIFPLGDIATAPKISLEYDGTAEISTEGSAEDTNPETVLSVEENTNSYSIEFVKGRLTNMTVSVSITPEFYGNIHYTLKADDTKLGEYYREVGGALYPELQILDEDEITEFSGQIKISIMDRNTGKNIAEYLEEYVDKVTITDPNGKNVCTLPAQDLATDENNNILLNLADCWQNYGKELFGQGREDTIKTVILTDSSGYQSLLDLKKEGKALILYAEVVDSNGKEVCVTDTTDTIIGGCSEYLGEGTGNLIKTTVLTTDPAVFNQQILPVAQQVSSATISNEKRETLCKYPSEEYPDITNFAAQCKQDFAVENTYREYPFKELFTGPREYTLTVASKTDNDGKQYFRQGGVSSEISVLACSESSLPKGLNKVSVATPTEEAEEVSMEVPLIQQCKNQGVGISTSAGLSLDVWYTEPFEGSSEEVHCLEREEGDPLACALKTEPYTEDADNDGYSDTVTFEIDFSKELLPGETRKGNISLNLTLQGNGIKKQKKLEVPLTLESKEEQEISTEGLTLVPTEYGNFEPHFKMTDSDKIDCSSHMCNLRQVLLYNQANFNTVYYTLVPEEFTNAYKNIAQEIIDYYTSQGAEVKESKSLDELYATCDPNKEPFAELCFTDKVEEKSCLPEIGTGELTIETLPVTGSDKSWSVACFNTQSLSELTDDDIQERFALFLPVDLESSFAEEAPETYNTLITVAVSDSQDKLKEKAVEMLKNAWSIPQDTVYPEDWISLGRDAGKSSKWEHELVIEECKKAEDKACQDMIKHMGTTSMPAGALPAVYVDDNHKVHVIGTSTAELSEMLDHLNTYFEGTSTLQYDSEHKIIVPRRTFTVWLNKNIPEDTVSENFNSLLIDTLKLESLKDLKIEYAEPGSTPFSSIIGWIDSPESFSNKRYDPESTSTSDYKARFAGVNLNTEWMLPENTAVLWEGRGKVYISVPGDKKKENANSLITFAQTGDNEDEEHLKVSGEGEKLLVFKFPDASISDLTKVIEEGYVTGEQKTYAFKLKPIDNEYWDCTSPVAAAFSYSGIDLDNNGLTAIRPGKVVVSIKAVDGELSSIDKSLAENMGLKGYKYLDTGKSKVSFLQASSTPGSTKVLPGKKCTWFFDPEPKTVIGDGSSQAAGSDPTAVFALNSYPSKIIVPTEYTTDTGTEVSNFKLGSTTLYNLGYDLIGKKEVTIPVSELTAVAYGRSGDKIDEDTCSQGTTCKLDTNGRMVAYVTVTAKPEEGSGDYMFTTDGFIRVKYSAGEKEVEFPAAAIGYTDLATEEFSPGWVGHLYSTDYRIGLEYPSDAETEEPSSDKSGEVCGKKYSGKCEKHRVWGTGCCDWPNVKQSVVYCDAGDVCYSEASRRCDDEIFAGVCSGENACHATGNDGMCISCPEGEFPRMGVMSHGLQVYYCAKLPDKNDEFGQGYRDSDNYVSQATS